MMAMISPALEAFNENLSTLKFANRAKNIKNDPRINEDLDQKVFLLLHPCSKIYLFIYFTCLFFDTNTIM